MSAYEIVMTVLTVVRLVFDVIKLCVEHKKSRPDLDK